MAVYANNAGPTTRRVSILVRAPAWWSDSPRSGGSNNGRPPVVKFALGKRTNTAVTTVPRVHPCPGGGGTRLWHARASSVVHTTQEMTRTLPEARRRRASFTDTVPQSPPFPSTPRPAAASRPHGGREDRLTEADQWFRGGPVVSRWICGPVGSERSSPRTLQNGFVGHVCFRKGGEAAHMREGLDRICLTAVPHNNPSSMWTRD